MVGWSSAYLAWSCGCSAIRSSLSRLGGVLPGAPCCSLVLHSSCWLHSFPYRAASLHLCCMHHALAFRIISLFHHVSPCPCFTMHHLSLSSFFFLRITSCLDLCASTRLAPCSFLLCASTCGCASFIAVVVSSSFVRCESVNSCLHFAHVSRIALCQVPSGRLHVLHDLASLFTSHSLWFSCASLPPLALVVSSASCAFV